MEHLKKTWIEVVVDAFEGIGGQGHVQDIYNYIQTHTDRVLPTTWKASVRKNIEHYSKDSEAFLGKDNLFETVNGLHRGVWKLIKFQSTPPVPDLINDLDESNNTTRVKTEVYRIIRDTKMIKELKSLYNNSCQICGLVIRIKKQNYSEGHHIKPLGSTHSGPDVKSNILILCPNHHAEFDYGVLAIDPKTHEILSKGQDVSGFVLNIKHTLNERYLSYHFTEIFNK